MSPAKSWEVDAQELSQRARSLLVQAALWAPSMADPTILEALAEHPDPGKTAPSLLAGAGVPEDQLSPTQPVVRRRNGTDGATAAVVRLEHKVASVPRNKQLSFPAITSPRHSTHPTVLIFDPFNFLQNRVGSLASPPHFRVRAAFIERLEGIDGKGMTSKCGWDMKKSMCVRFFFVQPGVVSTCNVTERISSVNSVGAVFRKGVLLFAWIVKNVGAMLRHVSKGMWGVIAGFFEQSLVRHFLENSTPAFFPL